MKTYSKDELSKILEDHKMWLNDHNTGNRANLQGSIVNFPIACPEK